MTSVFIFDYDGVLVDSFELFMNLFLKACKNHGWNQISTKKEFLYLFEGNMFEYMMNHGMSRQDILDVVLEVKEGLLTHLDDICLFPGLQETLEYLSRTHILCISTSNDTAVVKTYLKKQHLTVFDEVFGSDIHPSKIKKIELIKQRYPADEYAYIGDTIGDIKEGKKAGVKTVAVTWGWHTKQQLQQANPDVLIDQVADLKTIPKMIA
jgi:phosphoglycolate phosphatase